MLITLSVAGVLVLMALAAQTWVLRHVFAQQARIQLRLDALSLRTATGSTAGPDPTHLEPAPPFDLPSLDHGRANLDRMLAAGNPVVLTFTDPRCAPCYEVLPEPPARHKEQVLAVGDAVPAIRRPDLNGNVVDFAAELRGEQTLLLFWSPGCTHCQELLPTMRAWEADPAGPRLLIVSRGPVALIQETGLRSTVLLDDDQTVARRFGVMSSPVAFMIDSMGRVASPMARGSVAVRTLGSQ